MYRKLAPVLVAPLLVAAACASEADDATVEVRADAALVALQDAPDAAAEAGTSSFEMVVAMSVGGHDVELVATGQTDAANQRMSMEMDMTAIFEQLAATTGDTAPDGLTAPMQLVVDGSTVYLRAPMFESLGGPSGWLSVAPDQLGLTSDQLGIGGYDPSALLESLRGVTGEPEVVGTEDVRGVPTTHYRATVDLADAVARVPEAQRALVEGQLEQLGDATVLVDVWIDADDLPRRLQVDMGDALAATGLGGSASAVVTMEVFDYGEPVDIEVPPPDEVRSLGEGLGLGGSIEGSS